MSFVDTIMYDPNWSFVALALIVVLFTQVIKLPIKALLNLLIKNKAVLQRVNVVFMLLPIGFSVLAQVAHSILWGNGELDLMYGLKISTCATAIYAFLEQLFKGKKSKETEAVQQLVEDITKDGKVDEKDKSAVKDFLDKVK